MKTSKMFSMNTASLLLLALVFAFAFTSCGDNDSGGAKTALEGNWVSNYGETIAVSRNSFTYLGGEMGVKGTFSLDERNSYISMNFSQFSENNGRNWYTPEQMLDEVLKQYIGESNWNRLSNREKEQYRDMYREYVSGYPSSDSGYYYQYGDTLVLECYYVSGTYYRTSGGGDRPNPGGGGSNNFIGTWSDGSLTVVCDSSSWTAIYYNEYVGSGTYTPNGNSATFTTYEGYLFGTATVSGNTMTVRVDGSTYYLTKGGGGNPVGPSVPGTPSNVTAITQSSSSIYITWETPTSGGTPSLYYIYRSSSSTGSYSYLDSTSSLYYINSGLSSSTTYYYKVAAYNSAGTGPQSGYVYATTSGGGGTIEPGTTIDLTSGQYYANTMTSGGVHYYRFYASTGTYYVMWEDSDNSSYTADIIVGVKREGSSTYTVAVSDYNSTNQISFNVTSGNVGYYIIEVRGIGNSSYGTYRVGYY